MSDKKTEHIEPVAKKQMKINKGLLIFVCIFVSVAIIFGATLGIIMGVKNARAAVKYNGLTMEAETVSFFVSYHKSLYIKMLLESGITEAADAFHFWESESESGETYGELLRQSSEAYIRQIIVAAYLYDNYTSMTSGEKENIENVIREVIDNKANGDKESFNSLVARYGFSYDSFVDAATILYKSQKVKSILYGSDGSNISLVPELCDEYLLSYSHVKLLFIRTEDEFQIDENGNRIEGEEGYATRPLTEKEREERSAAIEDIRSYIDAIENGGDILMSPEMFDSYLKKYDNASEIRHTSGYYLHSSSKYTAGFAEEISKDVVKTALSAEIGSYTEVEWEHGVCFIYKYEPAKNAYASSLLEIYFEDFYSDAATYFFGKTLDELISDVEFTEKYTIDPVTVPYNSVYIPKF